MSANPGGTGLVISEVYGGGGNSGATLKNDFIELYNPTAAPISVAGLSVQYRSGTGTGTGFTNLVGSVPANGHYLIAEAAGAGGTVDLPTPDATGNLAMSATGGAVALVTGTGTQVVANGGANIVDLVGYGPATVLFESAPTTATANATSASRNAARLDTDNNLADFTIGTPAPQNSGPVTPVALEATSPGNKTGQVGVPVAGFTLAATGGTSPYTWTATGLPDGVSVAANGAVSGTPTTAGAYDVTATVTDSAGTPATDDVTFTFTITGAAALMPIAEIQGTGDASPMVGQNVKTQGVVTALYPVGGFNGFFIQTQGTGGGADATPGASDGIFVFGGAIDESTLAVGDFLEVTGAVSEFFNSTQITPAAAGDVVVKNGDTHTDPTPLAAALPGTSCVVGACPTAAALAADREAHEGELYAPTGPFTVTNAFSLTNGGNGFMEIGLAADTKPLIAPTEVRDFQTGNVAELAAYNAAHSVVLDDGSSFNYTAGDNGATPRQSGIPMPWINATHTVRVGAEATFTGPVILDFRNNAWKLQPTAQVTGIGANVATFEQTRAANAAPTDVGGDLVLGTFNVLNYFNTTGQAWAPGCTFFNDRELNPITNNVCANNGPRGAARTADLARQQAKIVTAINTMDADVVSLEEIENSVALGEADRDDALAALVTALNAAAGTTRWAFAPSPPAADLPPTAEQDVIRTAFIYNPATVALVGPSDVLADAPAFANAREPLAQAFKKVGNPDASAFGVIVNHFKSKSTSGASGDNLDTGQGGFNGDRTRQAAALVAFAEEFKTSRGISRMFLAGDFNSYSEEDPVQALEEAGYTQVESDTEGEESYSFSGLSGSLDHVFANDAALATVTGADIWDINASEPLAYQYSRFNYNVTDFFDATNPFNSSDHNPEVIGIDTTVAATETEIQILGINDFHGRLLNEDGTNGTTNGIVAGAAILSGAVKQLRTENPNTVFAAAGDLIGASTFESFIQKDKPTIDALNEAGLEVSAVGNHELDAGYNDLVDRVMAPYDATTNPLGGAEWEYIAANLRKKSDHTHAVPDSWIKDFGDVQVGFVGAVTEDLPSLVSPDGIADIEVTDIVSEVNESADALEADGADVIVLLIHEGAATTSFASATDPNSAFGQVVNGVDTNIDAIVSGHTHLAYNHAVPVPAWVSEGRAVTTRPVVSAGQYGTFLNQLNLTVDNATGDVLGLTQNVLNLKAQLTPFAANYPVDPAVVPIVQSAIDESNVLGAVELGKIAAPFNRAKLANGTTENRGGESTLGNLVAEVQRWATESPEAGGAQIAFMNPGGLRQDMVGNAGGYPATLTYKQAAVVQPFANTLVNMQLTGAQIKTALEQQWQRDGNGNIPTRPFLRLGTSEGFSYTYDPSRAEGDRVLRMWLNGTPIGAATSYSVTVNSFLGSGGDNFRVFAQGSQKRDTGKVDLQGMVDYMAEFANVAEGDDPLAPDFTQHSVGVVLPDGSSFATGGTVRVNLSSLAFSTAADQKDSQVEVFIGDESLGTFPVDNTIGTAVFDEYGTSAIAAVLPGSAGVGAKNLRIVGATTGTTVLVPITIAKGASTVTATASPAVLKAKKGTTTISVTVTRSGGTPTGTVEAVLGGQVLGTGVLSGGSTSIVIGPFATVGVKTITLRYLGDDLTEAGTGTTSVTVVKGNPKD